MDRELWASWISVYYLLHHLNWWSYSLSKVSALPADPSAAQGYKADFHSHNTTPSLATTELGTVAYGSSFSQCRIPTPQTRISDLKIICSNTSWSVYKWNDIIYKIYFKIIQYGGGESKVGGAHKWDKIDYELIIIEATWWEHTDLWYYHPYIYVWKISTES